MTDVCSGYLWFLYRLWLSSQLVLQVTEVGCPHCDGGSCVLAPRAAPGATQGSTRRSHSAYHSAVSEVFCPCGWRTALLDIFPYRHIPADGCNSWKKKKNHLLWACKGKKYWGTGETEGGSGWAAQGLGKHYRQHPPLGHGGVHYRCASAQPTGIPSAIVKSISSHRRTLT